MPGRSFLKFVTPIGMENFPSSAARELVEQGIYFYNNF